MNIEKIREDFPILKRKINGKPLIYFDNTATSQRPISVIEAISDFYKKHNANVHRGIHILSEEASEMYENAHDIVADFIGAKSREEIIFVRNTTEAINLVAYAYGIKNLHENDEIAISIMEHHSNMLPWIELSKRTKTKLKIIDINDKNFLLDYDNASELITDKTKIVAITQASNVLGTVNDIEYICKLAKENDAILVVDGAQSVPHIPVDVNKIGCDFLAFSGHKMLGPTGIGVLYVKRDLIEHMDPFMVGGGMISSVDLDLQGRYKITYAESPWRWEAGTPNIADGIGLAAAIKYLQKIGMENIKDHEFGLTKYTLDRLYEELEEKMDIYGPEPKHRVGIIPFNIKGLDPHVVALYLNEYGICVRSGFHCAQPLHNRLGIKQGTVRASFYLYNTEEEVDYFIDALKEISSKK